MEFYLSATLSLSVSRSFSLYRPGTAGNRMRRFDTRRTSSIGHRPDYNVPTDSCFEWSGKFCARNQKTKYKLKNLLATNNSMYKGVHITENFLTSVKTNMRHGLNPRM